MREIFPSGLPTALCTFPPHNYTTFSGAVTNNNSANKIARKLLKKRFLSRFFQGCFPHGLNLLVKEILNARKKNKGGSNGSTYHLGYPWEYLLTFIVECK